MSCLAKESRQPKDRRYWAKVWFGKLAKFHRIRSADGWEFSPGQVVAFLRQQRDRGCPAWKRLKIVEALMDHQRASGQGRSHDLQAIRSKLLEIAIREKSGNQVRPPIEEAVGRIPKNESDVVQAMRRKMRMHGKKYNTEKAYVRWVKRFIVYLEDCVLEELDRIAASSSSMAR